MSFCPSCVALQYVWRSCFPFPFVFTYEIVVRTCIKLLLFLFCFYILDESQLLISCDVHYLGFISVPLLFICCVLIKVYRM